MGNDNNTFKKETINNPSTLINNPVVVKVEKKKKHYWWRYLLVFMFGIFFTIGSTIGGTVVVSSVMTTQQVLSAVRIDSSTYLTEKYQNMSILDIIKGVASGEVDLNSLDGISQITPYVEELFNEINKMFLANFGFTIDFNDLKNVDWANIGQAFLNEMKSSITIAGIMGVNSDSALVLKYISFPKKEDGTYDYDNPYSLNYLMANFNSLFDNMLVSDVVDCSGVPALAGLANKKISNLATEFQTMKISDFIHIDETSPKALQFFGKMQLNADFNAAINSAKISDLLDVGEKGILYNISDCTIGGIATEIETKKLNQIIDIPAIGEPNYNKALSYLGNFTQSGLSTALNDAKIGDLFDVGTNPDAILYKLKDKKINEVNNTIKLGEILTIDDTSSLVLVALKDTPINELSTKIETLKLEEVMKIDETDPNTSKVLIALKNKNATLSNINDIIKSLTLNDMIDINDSSAPVLKALASETLDTLDSKITTLKLGEVIEIDETNPDTSPILIALKNVTINAKDISDAIKTLSLENLLNLDSSSPAILWALKDKTILDLTQETINQIGLGQIFTSEQISGSKILDSLVKKGATIGNIGEILNSLTIEDVITVDETSSLLLQSLASTTLQNLGTKINNLTISNVFSAEEIAANAFLSALPPDTLLSNMGNAINDLSFVAVFKDEVYKPGTTELKGTWSFLLDDPHNASDTPADYKLTSASMAKMILNFQENLKISNLFKLCDNSFLDVERSVLEKKIIGDTKAIGNYTISEFISKLTPYLI